jgi:hypothetical protein
MFKFIVAIAYMAYDGFQALRAMNGKRKENPGLLIFFAGLIDFYALVKKLYKKLFKKTVTPAKPSNPVPPVGGTGTPKAA